MSSLYMDSSTDEEDSRASSHRRRPSARRVISEAALQRRLRNASSPREFVTLRRQMMESMIDRRVDLYERLLQQASRDIAELQAHILAIEPQMEALANRTDRLRRQLDRERSHRRSIRRELTQERNSVRRLHERLTREEANGRLLHYRVDGNREEMRRVRCSIGLERPYEGERVTIPDSFLQPASLRPATSAPGAMHSAQPHAPLDPQLNPGNEPNPARPRHRGGRDRTGAQRSGQGDAGSYPELDPTDIL